MIEDWSRLITDLFFPRICAVCGRTLNLKESHLCLHCFAGLPLTFFWKLKENPAEEVFWGRISLCRVYALFYYTNEYRSPLHRLKYGNDIGIGLYLGELLGKKIEVDSSLRPHPIDYIVPVPLHYRKRWKRGYNQAEIIAKGILEGFSNTSPKLLSNLLQRKKFTKTQTQKSRIDRWQNVSNAFRINPRVAEKLLKRHMSHNGNTDLLHLLLVDDVLTTGATLEACAQLLQEYLNCNISIATLAYVE